MTILFFSKCLKFDVDWRKRTNNSEKVGQFSDNWIWIGSCKFLQLWTGYLPSAVNVLTKSRKISPNSEGHIFQMNFTQNEKKKLIKALSWKLGSICDTFTFWLPKPVLKQWCWESFLTKIFTVCNSGSTLAMTMIFSFKVFKLWWRIEKGKKWWRKSFLFFK